VIYIDTSALLKLVHPEPETMPLRTWLARHQEDLVSSAPIRAESRRALLRNDPAGLINLPRVLAFVAQIPMTEEVLDRAAMLPDPVLRTLEAIHLASAQTIPGVKMMLAHDSRLAKAARNAGLTVATPT
jgi:predicted nucleic acid-binding protein